MNKKKLVIVTYAFPPVNSIASRRWSEMLPILSKEYKVFVFTTDGVGILPIPTNLVEIIRFKSSKTSQGDISNKKNEKSFGKVLIAYLRRGMRTIDSTIFDFYLINRKVFSQKLELINPDLIITSVGPFSAALFGFYAKNKISDIKWIVDIRDSMSLYPYYKKNLLKRFLDREIDKYIIRKSDVIITVSESLANIFEEFYGKKCRIVYNGYNDLRKYISNEPDMDKMYKIIYYGGKMYDHQLKSLDYLCKTLEKFKNSYKLKMRIFDTKYRQLVAENLKNYSFSYEVLPPTDDEQYNKELTEADILLLLEDIDKRFLIGRGTLTGKLFNYMPYKAPILTICRKDSDIKSILSEVKRGSVCDNGEEITEFLSSDMSVYEGNEEIFKYTRENQAKNLVKLLNED